MNESIKRAVLAACAAAAWAAENYTPEQLQARFYYDLGPAALDVSSYPEVQRSNYAVFARTCSQCHSLARPINAPIAARKDWTRYVQRMHLHTKVRPGTRIAPQDAKVIIDFLAYDSKIRKIDGKADFQAQQSRLRELFAKIQKARDEMQAEKNRARVIETPMGSTEKPYAGSRYP